MSRRKQSRHLSISEVASAARVSTTTVSRVINNVSTVTAANRERVLVAIKRMGYRPNPNAQRLASGAATPTVALMIPRYSGIFQTYYAPEVIKGIGTGAERLRIDLLLRIADGKSLPVRSAAGGVLFLDIDGCEELVERALDEGLPAVVLNHYVEDLPVSCVAIDNEGAAERVVEYLLKLGHREIATITGDLKTQAGLHRFNGFVKALKGRQLALRDDYIRYGDFSLASARAAAQALLSLKDRPTAIFVGSDDMALEAIAVALDKGLRVPEELSIVGFDDNAAAAHGRVPLTTVRQPLGEMGRRGLELLAQLMAGKRHSPLKLLLPTELIERSSTRQTWFVR